MWVAETVFRALADPTRRARLDALFNKQEGDTVSIYLSERSGSRSARAARGATCSAVPFDKLMHNRPALRHRRSG